MDQPVYEGRALGKEVMRNPCRNAREVRQSGCDMVFPAFFPIYSLRRGIK